MVVARASGMDLASSLKRNTFLTLEVRPAGGPGSARDGGTEGGPGRGDTGGPGTGGHGGPNSGLNICLGWAEHPFGVPTEKAEIRDQQWQGIKGAKLEGGRGCSAQGRIRRDPKKAFWGRNLRMAQSRRQVRPRSSRLQHSASFRARNPNKASMTLMLAAASIEVMDALFGLVVRNNAEWSR